MFAFYAGKCISTNIDDCTQVAEMFVSEILKEAGFDILLKKWAAPACPKATGN